LQAPPAAVPGSLRAFGLTWRLGAARARLGPPVAQGALRRATSYPFLLLLAACDPPRRILCARAPDQPQNGRHRALLVRERAWRSLGAGLLALLLLVVARCRWRGRSLASVARRPAVYRSRSINVPSLNGVVPRALPTDVGFPWWFAAFTVLAALAARGREGLARLGWHPRWPRPSLFLHGFVIPVPSFCRLRAEVAVAGGRLRLASAQSLVPSSRWGSEWPPGSSRYGAECGRREGCRWASAGTRCTRSGYGVEPWPAAED